MKESTLKFCGNPTLETERLILRKLGISDAQDVFEYARYPEVARYTTWDAHKSVEDAKAFIIWTLERYKRDKAGEWGIELKKTGRLVGAMGFVQLDLPNSLGSIGYVLSKEYWGKGIMTEAVRRLIYFGFEEMKLNRIEAVHIPENEASGRVMKKAGMSFEGLLRQRLFSKGKFWDVKQYSIIKKDWVFIKEVDIATKDDLDEILKLQKLAYQSEAAIYNDYGILPLTQTLEELQEEAKSSIVLKIIQDRKIVGSVRAFEKDGTCYIGRLIVHPEYQNRGIGKKLMHAIEGCFRGARYELFTGHLSDKNLALYEKLGYKRFRAQDITDNLKFIYLEKDE